MSEVNALQQAHRRMVVLVVVVLISAMAFAYVAKIFDVVTTTGKLVADHNLVLVHAPASGLVTRVFASVGDHVDAQGPLLALDPNMSADRLADSEHRLASAQEERTRVKKALEVVSQVVTAPDRMHPEGLRDLGVVGDTFNLINDLYTARLELENANEYRHTTAVHQRAQINSEIALVQRNIELLKRNLEVGKKDAKMRDDTLALKRSDFEALMKLAEKGLVSATDVTRERDQLLQAELAFTENRKQVDQVELDISNRSLHINELKMQSEQVGEEASNRYNAAKLHFDLRLARLTEHKASLERQLQAIDLNISNSENVLRLSSTGHSVVIVTAPSAGMLIGLRYVSPGDGVPAGSLVATLLPDGVSPVVLAKLPNRDVGRVREGQSARVKVDAYPYLQFGTIDATVVRVFAEPDHSDFTAKLVLQSPTIDVRGRAMPLLPGMHTHVDVFTEQRRLLELLVNP